MTDRTELKRLAEAFPEYDYDSNTEPFFNGPSGESLGGGSTGFYCVYGPEFEIDGESYEGVTLVESCPADQAKFICKAKAGILALIAENDRLKTLRSTTERDLAQELEVWRHGPSCWNCGDTGDVHDIVGEWRGKCDCFSAQLIDATQERDQLRAEVEGLRTGYEAYERVNAELKAENESLMAKRLARATRAKNLVGIASSHRRDALVLRKDLESHKRMLLAAVCDLGAIGEALGAEMDDDGSELEGIATELRKDAERLQNATAFVQKLCDSAGRQPSVATGYLHDILSALGQGEQS